MCGSAARSLLCPNVTFMIRFVFKQDGETFTVYPKSATHSTLSARNETPGKVLIDILCMADRLPEAQLVQALMKLERCQLCLATVKSLSEEENTVCEVEEAGLLKMELDKAKLAPAIAQLDSHIKMFGVFISSLPQSVLQTAPLAEYGFPQVVLNLESMFQIEANTAIDRWKDVCVSAITTIKAAFPETSESKMHHIF